MTACCLKRSFSLSLLIQRLSNGQTPPDSVSIQDVTLRVGLFERFALDHRIRVAVLAQWL